MKIVISLTCAALIFLITIIVWPYPIIDLSNIEKITIEVMDLYSFKRNSYYLFHHKDRYLGFGINRSVSPEKAYKINISETEITEFFDSLITRYIYLGKPNLLMGVHHINFQNFSIEFPDRGKILIDTTSNSVGWFQVPDPLVRWRLRYENFEYTMLQEHGRFNAGLEQKLKKNQDEAFYAFNHTPYTDMKLLSRKIFESLILFELSNNN